jgi:hypothetical protein
MTTAVAVPDIYGRTPQSFDEVRHRVDDLTSAYGDDRIERDRIRQILRGGADGLKALLGQDLQVEAADIPAVNLMASSLEIFAAKVGRYPHPKASPPWDRDSQRARDHADKIRQIVTGYDQQQRIHLAIKKAARRVGAYAYAPFVITDRRGSDGRRYPIGAPKDPHDCYLGQWSEIDQQPVDMAVIRKVSIQTLEWHYGEQVEKLRKSRRDRKIRESRGSVVLDYGGSKDRQDDPDLVDYVEYHNNVGSYSYIEGYDGFLEFIPNPLESGARFVVPYFPFVDDRPRPRFVHVLGLMAAQAKLNTLQIVAAKDAVFRETNVIGQMTSGTKYEFGRRKFNTFAPGTQIERPSHHVDPSFFTAIDRTERQIRVQLGYPVSEDGISPMSYTTGAGVRELGGGPNLAVSDTQEIFSFCLELLDAKRLEWDEKVHNRESGLIEIDIRGKSYSTRYIPGNDIRGYYRTRRPYPALSFTFDDPTTIVTGLQLLQQGVIDLATFRQAIDGLESVEHIDQRVNRDRAVETLYAALGQLIAQGDPRAGAVLARIINDPDSLDEEVARFFTPDEPAMTADEQALVAAGNGQGPPGTAPITTILSRLELGGGAEGGVQTVGSNR